MMRIRLMLLVMALGFYGLGSTWAQRPRSSAEPAASEEKPSDKAKDEKGGDKDKDKKDEKKKEPEEKVV